MKILVAISRILVGVLFIISGLIKLNDPLGFSYKLQEYFSTDVLNIPFLEPYALGISIFVVVFEVVLGVFLLIGYKPKFTIWSLLGMIVFFTFLTFYSAYFNKVTDCGCFGDAIPLTSWQSFTKDVILSVLVILIFIRRNHFKPLMGIRTGDILIGLTFLLNIYLSVHSIRHLPYIDFRPYKVGNNIPELMSPSEPYRYKYIMEKDGEEFEFMEKFTYEKAFKLY